MNEQHKSHVYAWEDFKTSRHHAFAHKQAIEVASKTADPIFKPALFHQIYWTVMGGYGFRPYVIGGGY